MAAIVAWSDHLLDLHRTLSVLTRAVTHTALALVAAHRMCAVGAEHEHKNRQEVFRNAEKCRFVHPRTDHSPKPVTLLEKLGPAAAFGRAGVQPPPPRRSSDLNDAARGAPPQC